jgi:hypothetical protein
MACNGEVDYKNIPNICFQCGSIERDFWDQIRNNWIQRKIVFGTYKQAIWLTGDFVGDYVGDLIAPLSNHSIEDLSQVARSYDVRITEGQLDNYSFTDTLDFPDFSRHLIMSKMKRRGLYATHQIYGRI